MNKSIDDITLNRVAFIMHVKGSVKLIGAENESASRVQISASSVAFSVEHSLEKGMNQSLFSSYGSFTRVDWVLALEMEIFIQSHRKGNGKLSTKSWEFIANKEKVSVET